MRALATVRAEAKMLCMRMLALAVALLVTACAPHLDRRVYLSSLVGVPEAEVVRQIGVPTRTYETSGHKFLAYTEQRADYIAGGPFFFGGGFGGGFYGPRFGYAAFPPQVIERVCETTFDIAEGRVLTWSLRGNACG